MLNKVVKSTKDMVFFTCLSSRAIHIEMLEDLTTESFINALRRFIGIRGTVRQVVSDQGTNFVGAKNELTKALMEVDKQRLTTYLAQSHRRSLGIAN